MRFGIARSLGQTHALRVQLIRMFDPGYYGRIRLPRMIRSALRRDPCSEPTARAPRLLKSFVYERQGEAAKWTPRERPTWVVPVAAELKGGRLVPLPQGLLKPVFLLNVADKRKRPKTGEY